MTSVVTAERWLELVAHEGTFSSTRFGFTPRAEPCNWGGRRLDEHLLCFCMRNGFEIAAAERSARLVRGSFIWIMPGVWHETRLLAANRAFRNYFVRFTLADREESRVRLEQDWIHHDNAWHMLPYVRDLVLELQSPRPFHEQRVRASLMMLTASAVGEEVVRGPAVFSPQQRLRLQAFLDMATSRKITPQHLADETGLSITYFRRIFHRSFGMSPTQWIMRHRIQVAASMMSETQLSAKEIAYRLGYCDRFLFSRQFKQVMGITPRQFRGCGGSEQVCGESEYGNASRDLRKPDALNPRQ